MTAPAPSGAGEEREARAGSGGCTPKYYIELGAKNNALVQHGLLQLNIICSYAR
jgi:hypothetical protein